jgi:hypothetical protein
MINNLHNELSRLELQYHELGAITNGTIVLVAKSLAGEGVFEVMQIKELADKFNLVTKWDGQSIEITR